MVTLSDCMLMCVRGFTAMRRARGRSHSGTDESVIYHVPNTSIEGSRGVLGLCVVSWRLVTSMMPYLICILYHDNIGTRCFRCSRSSILPYEKMIVQVFTARSDAILWKHGYDVSNHGGAYCAIKCEGKCWWSHVCSKSLHLSSCVCRYASICVCICVDGVNGYSHR